MNEEKKKRPKGGVEDLTFFTVSYNVTLLLYRIILYCIVLYSSMSFLLFTFGYNFE